MKTILTTLFLLFTLTATAFGQVLPGPGFLTRPATVSGGDPYWSSVVTLLQPQNAVGSTTFVNEKGGASFTRNGDVVVSSQTPFSTGTSASFDGIGDDLQLTLSSDQTFAADFTIEAFVRPTTITGNDRGIITSFASSGWILKISSTGNLYWYDATSGVKTSSGTISLNTWTHVAVVRSNTSMAMYINGGTPVLTWTRSGTITGEGSFRIGTLHGFNQPFIGQIIGRATKAARYAAGFTPPTTPFPIN